MGDEDNIPQCIIATANVKPECCDDWERTFNEQAKKCYEKEPGLLLYYMTKDRKEPTKYTVLEMYANRAAFKEHAKHVMSIRDPARDKMTNGPLEGHVMPVVGMIPPKVDLLDSCQVAMVAHLPVKPENAAKFEEAFRIGIPDVGKNEAGCAMYAWAKDRKNEGMYHVIEIYKDQDAVKAHGSSAHVKEAVKRWTGAGMNMKDLKADMRQPVSKSHGKAPPANAKL